MEQQNALEHLTADQKWETVITERTKAKSSGSRRGSTGGIGAFGRFILRLFFCSKPRPGSDRHLRLCALPDPPARLLNPRKRTKTHARAPLRGRYKQFASLTFPRPTLRRSWTRPFRVRFFCPMGLSVHLMLGKKSSTRSRQPAVGAADKRCGEHGVGLRRAASGARDAPSGRNQGPQGSDRTLAGKGDESTPRVSASYPLAFPRGVFACVACVGVCIKKKGL